MSINLYRVIQPVTDIEEAARFYSAALGDEGERVSSRREQVELPPAMNSGTTPSAFAR